MVRRSEMKKLQGKAAQLLQQAGIRITDDEINKIDTVDFGLGRIETEGAQIWTLVQTGRISVKIIALLPGQTLPEHWHPPVGSDPGKEETVRTVWGTVYSYIEGPDTLQNGFIVEGKEKVYTLRHELVLRPGDQFTFSPGQKHWFQAGNEGAVLYSFSTIARDALDGFTDPAIDRITKIVDD